MRRYRGYIFDLDGTIYLGERTIPGAPETVHSLRKAGCRVTFISNKPLEPRERYAAKLTRLGIPTRPDDVINSSLVAAVHLSEEMPGARVFVIGEDTLKRALRDAGLRAAETPEETDIVLISLDRDLSYDKIHFAYRAAKQGARVMAPNPDLVCPMPDDEIIDAGATIAVMEALLARPIDGVMGKPSPIIARAMMDRLKLPPTTLTIQTQIILFQRELALKFRLATITQVLPNTIRLTHQLHYSPTSTQSLQRIHSSSPPPSLSTTFTLTFLDFLNSGILNSGFSFLPHNPLSKGLPKNIISN